jgi:hypothetical protein
MVGLGRSLFVEGRGVVGSRLGATLHLSVRDERAVSFRIRIALYLGKKILEKRCIRGGTIGKKHTRTVVKCVGGSLRAAGDPWSGCAIARCCAIRRRVRDAQRRAGKATRAERTAGLADGSGRQVSPVPVSLNLGSTERTNDRAARPRLQNGSVVAHIQRDVDSAEGGEHRQGATREMRRMDAARSELPHLARYHHARCTVEGRGTRTTVREESCKRHM